MSKGRANNIMKVFTPSEIKKQVVRSVVLTIDGEDGLIYFKPIPGRLLQSLAEGDLSEKDTITRVSIRLSETLVNEDGSPLMTPDEMLDVPWETQKYILERIAEETGKERKPGEGSSGVQSSAQSTN